MQQDLPQAADTVAIDVWPAMELAPLNDELKACIEEIEAIDKRERHVMKIGKVASTESNKFRRCYGYVHRELDQLVDDTQREVIELSERKEEVAKRQREIESALLVALADRERAHLRCQRGRTRAHPPAPQMRRSRSSHRVVRAAASSAKASTGDPLGDPDPDSSQRTPQIGGAL